MRVVALISGGKDSCFNMMQCVAEGHEIVALANLRPKDKDELDSYMYQSVGHHAIGLYAEAMGLPLYRRTIEGTSMVIGRDYIPNQQDEVEDLYQLLETVQEEVSVQAVSIGAILSNYQRVRVENVCLRLGLTPLAYLWRRDQEELLDEMIESKVKAIIIKVAAMGLNPDKHLGKTLSEMRAYLHKMKNDFELNVCGEGGEFESFTLDCPLFKKTIVIDETESVLHSPDAFAPVGYLNLKRGHLEEKTADSNLSQKERLKDVPMKRGSTLYSELFPETEQPPDVNYTETLTPCITDPLKEDVPLCVHCREEHLWVSGVMVKYRDGEDIQTLAMEAMTQLKDTVCKTGDNWDMSCVVLVHLYVRNMEDFANINAVYRNFFGLNPAARVCVQASLPANVAMQLDCYGYCCHGDRETMHVQGLSHWAPANIGPYSQAVMINRRIYVAGQIAMCPSNLKIIPGGILAESRLSLRHVNLVLSAINAKVDIKQVVSCVCYLTKHTYISSAKQEWNRARGTIDSPKGSLPCPVQYVVIAVLPKNAQVEWQVTAVQMTVRQCRELVESHCTDKLDVTARCLCTDDLEVVTSTANVYLQKDTRISNIKLAEVFTAFFTCYKKLLKKTSSSTQDLPMLRIFYPSLTFTYQDMYNGLTAVLEGVPFSLVPVTGLETEDMVLCASA